MLLDLSGKTPLSIHDSRLMDESIDEINSIFNELVEELITKNNIKNLNALVGYTSRNPSSNPLYSMISFLVLIEKKLKKGEKLSTIQVNRMSEKTVILAHLKALNSSAKVIISSRLNNFSKELHLFFHIFLNILKSAWLIFLEILFSSIFARNNDINGKNLIILDNYVFPDSFNGESFFDRYYTGFKDYIGKLGKVEYYFLSNFFGFRSFKDYFLFYRNYKESKGNFLFSGSLLKILDYFVSFFKSIYLPVVKQDFYPCYKNISLQDYIYEMSLLSTGSMELNHAIQKYYVIKRLSKNNFNLLKVVKWHENLSIDRAAYIGFKKFFPQVKVYGYQGYFSASSEPHKIPENFEKQLDLLPDKIGVISESLLRCYANKASDVDLFLAPALRFNWLFSKKRKQFEPLDDQIKISISLPIFFQESANILNTCKTLTQSRQELKYQFKVKFHPSFNLYQKERLGVDENLFNISSDPIEELIAWSDVLITSGSSTAVESILMGVPTLIAANNYGISMNPIPPDLPKTFSRVFYDSNDIDDFLRILITNKQSICNSVNDFDINFFLEKPTTENVSRLFT